jgi:hypothetical protein
MRPAPFTPLSECALDVTSVFGLNCRLQILGGPFKMAQIAQPPKTFSEVKKKIEALKRRLLIEQPTKPRFEYDEDQPVQLVRKDEAAQR